MAICVKIDEDLPLEIAELFRNAGIEASTVLSQNMSGSSDSELWNAVSQAGQLLIAADKGFASMGIRSSGAAGGIVLLRTPRESRAEYSRLTEQVLSSFDLTAAIGAVVVVTPVAIRVSRWRPRGDAR